MVRTCPRQGTLLRRHLGSEVESGTLSPIPLGPPPTRKRRRHRTSRGMPGSHTAGNPNHRAEPRKSRRIPLLRHWAPPSAWSASKSRVTRGHRRDNRPSLPQTRQTMPLMGISNQFPSYDRNPHWAVPSCTCRPWDSERPAHSNSPTVPGSERIWRGTRAAGVSTPQRSNPRAGNAGRRSGRLILGQWGMAIPPPDWRRTPRCPLPAPESWEVTANPAGFVCGVLS